MAEEEPGCVQRPQNGPGSGIVILLGAVAIASMLFGFVLGLLF